MYFALFVLNLKDSIYIFTIIININTDIFVVFIFKFVNIILKKNSKLILFLFFKIFYLQILNFII